MSDYECVEYATENGAAVVRLDRPEKMNALSVQLIEDLTNALDRAESDDDVRAVILTGNGEAFSAGYDLGESGGRTEGGAPSAEDWLDRLESAPTHIHKAYELNVPVIAAVNGYAVAGGSDLALTCDLTIASERAEFGYPGMRMGGFPPTLIYPFVMGSIKYSKELLFSGKRVDADEAERFGMVNRTVAHDDLMDEAWKEVEEIKKVPRPVVRMAKHTLNGVIEMQGYRPMVKQSEFIDALAHVTEAGQRFFEIRDEEGVNAAIDWMNNVDK